MTTGDKNNVNSEIDCSNCKAVSFGKSAKLLQSDEYKGTVENFIFEKDYAAKHC